MTKCESCGDVTDNIEPLDNGTLMCLPCRLEHMAGDCDRVVRTDRRRIPNFRHQVDKDYNGDGNND